MYRAPHSGRIDGLVTLRAAMPAAVEEIDPAPFVTKSFHLNVLGPIVRAGRL